MLWKLSALLFASVIPAVLLVPHQPQQTEYCSQKYSCLNCTTTRVCKANQQGLLEQVSIYKCSNPDAPYCDPTSGTCTSLPPNPECAPVNSSLPCPYEGNFPHPTVNSLFYVCVKGVAHVHNCQNKCYDSKSESCLWYTGSTYCNTFKCPYQHNVKVPYGTDARYYAYCVDSKVLQVDKCPGKYVLNSATQTCVPNCSEEGVIGDVEDNTKYYKCSKTSPGSSNIVSSSYSCAPDQVFDALNLVCVPKKGNNTNVSDEFMYE